MLRTNSYHNHVDLRTVDVCCQIALLSLLVLLRNCRPGLYNALRCVQVVHICNIRLVLVSLCFLFLCLCSSVMEIVLSNRKDCLVQLDLFRNLCIPFLFLCILRSLFLCLCSFLCGLPFPLYPFLLLLRCPLVLFLHHGLCLYT